MSEINPPALSNAFYQHGKNWAETNAAAELLEETRKTLRSQIALKFLPNAGSVSKAEMMAEATQEYIDHIHAMVDARRVANTARAQFDSDRALIDLIRSHESSRRAEMQMR